MRSPNIAGFFPFLAQWFYSNERLCIVNNADDRIAEQGHTHRLITFASSLLALLARCSVGRACTLLRSLYLALLDSG
jgi:hypothetical protein